MENLITIGFRKGEADFSVSGEIGRLSYSEMKELRAMISVAIGTAEYMFRRGITSRPENAPQEVKFQNPLGKAQIIGEPPQVKS